MMRLILLISVLCTEPANAFSPLVHQDPVQFVEVAQHSVLAFGGKIAGAYTESLTQHPLYTKMLTGGVLATCGDAFAQSQNEDPYDKRRAASFFLFDMSYRALQHVSYPIVVHECQGQYLGSLLSAAQSGYAAPMEQTLAAQLLIVPFLYYPVFFSISGWLQGLSPSASLERAKETFLPLMRRNLMFWIPVQFFQFGFVDEQLQIPFLSVAGLCWTFILSVAAGSARNYGSSEEQIGLQESAVEDSRETFVVPRSSFSGASP